MYIGFLFKKIRDSLIPSFLVNDLSKLLRSLTKNERMSELLVFLSESLIAHIFAKNEQFAQKPDERIPSPALNKRVTMSKSFRLLRTID